MSLARNILDNPRAISQQAAAAGKLAEILDRLHTGADQRKSRLSVVRTMTENGGRLKRDDPAVAHL